MKGYFLEGINGEHILVLRTDDDETLLRVIRKLQTSREKEIKTLAQELELSWHDRHR